MAFPIERGNAGARTRMVGRRLLAVNGRVLGLGLAFGEMRREMAKKGRLLDYPVWHDAVALAPDEIQHLYDIIEMALRIDPARKGQPHQFVRRRNFAAACRGFPEHDAAKSDRADAAFEIKRVDEPNSGIVAWS